jgi:hypothetical protein
MVVISLSSGGNMAKAGSLNGREIGLYPDDIGQDRKPSAEGPARPRSYTRPIAAGALSLFLLGGGAAYWINTRAEDYSAADKEAAPVVQAAARDDTLKSGYPTDSQLKELALDQYKATSPDGSEFFNIKVTEMGEWEDGGIFIRVEADVKYKDKDYWTDDYMGLVKENGEWVVKKEWG